LKLSPKNIQNILWLAEHRGMDDAKLAQALGYSTTHTIEKLRMALSNGRHTTIMREPYFIAAKLGITGNPYMLAYDHQQFKAAIERQEAEREEREITRTIRLSPARRSGCLRAFIRVVGQILKREVCL
jgi:hypothetical protein